MELSKKLKENIRKNETFLYNFFLLVGVLTLGAVEFMVHARVPYMMDDLWYSTNLVTGEKLQGISDIIESQIWHFLNWGGRCMTHGLLQLVLMNPEWVADLLNVAMTLLLALVICKVSGEKGLLWYLMAFSALISLNANWRMSMFWQSGAVNYVYSSVWIFTYLWVYLRQMEKPQGKPLPFVNIWIVPLGVLAGWSNENMGPVCFITAVAAIIYLVGICRRHIELWQVEGAVTSLLGSCLVIGAPGNFVRKSALPQKGVLFTIWDRFLSMLEAGGNFLFPSFVLLAIILLLRHICVDQKLKATQWTLLAIVVLSFGAMVLSPHYPDRATFGTMAACIILMISLLSDLLRQKRNIMPYIAVLTFCFWSYAVYTLMDLYFSLK